MTKKFNTTHEEGYDAFGAGDDTEYEVFDEESGEWVPEGSLTTPYVEGSTDDIVSGTKAANDKWWQKYSGKSAGQGSLWGDTKDRGAKGLNKWLGSNNYSYTHYTSGASWGGYSSGQKLAMQAIAGMKFARDFALMGGRDSVKHIAWAGETRAGNHPGSTSVLLDPKPIKEIGQAGGPADQAEANSIIAGQALHDAGHARHTPNNAPLHYGALRHNHRITKEQAVTAGYIIEDAFIEAKNLEEFPGFQDYLDDEWRYLSPANQIVKAINANAGTLTMKGAVELIQDMGRRYEGYSKEEQAAYDSLPSETQRLLYHGAKIMDKGHNPSLTIEQRTKLADQLITLLEKGEIPPEDLDPGEDPKVKAPTGHLGEVLDKLAGEAKGHDGEGQNIGEETLSAEELADINNEAKKERELDKNPWPREIKSSMRDIEVQWLTPEITHREIRYYADAVKTVESLWKRLAKALHFRAAMASRQQMGQLRGKINDRALALAMTMRNPMGSKRVFKRKEILEAPKMGVEILVDVSGSTSGSVADAFRYSTTMVDNALRNLEKEAPGSVKWEIHAHSSDGTRAGSKSSSRFSDDWRKDFDKEACQIYRIIDDKHQDRDRIGHLFAKGNNYDSEALFAICRRMEKLYPDRQKLLIYLNDGQPAGHDYGGALANRQVKHVVDTYRKRGFTIITLYVGPWKAVERVMNQMYGAQGHGWIGVENIEEVPKELGRVISKALYWKA